MQPWKSHFQISERKQFTDLQIISFEMTGLLISFLLRCHRIQTHSNEFVGISEFPEFQKNSSYKPWLFISFCYTHKLLNHNCNCRPSLLCRKECKWFSKSNTQLHLKDWMSVFKFFYFFKYIAIVTVKKGNNIYFLTKCQWEKKF